VALFAALAVRRWLPPRRTETVAGIDIAADPTTA
jgi:hypothetical protein